MAFIDDLKKLKQEKEKKPGLFQSMNAQGQSIVGNVLQGAYNFGADISKIQRGTIGQDTGIPQGFVGNQAEIFQNAKKNIFQASQRQATGQQGAMETSFQQVGQAFPVVGKTVSNIFGSVLSTAIPEQLKESAGQVGQQIAQTGIGQQAMQGMQQVGQAYEGLSPRTKANIEPFLGAGEIGLNFAPIPFAKPIGKGLSTVAGGIETGVKKGVTGTARILGKTGEKIKAPGIALTRTIPERTIQNELKLTPTERATVERITGKTAPQYILDKGIANKSKEELAYIFEKQANDNYQGINKSLGTIKETVDSTSAREAVQDMIDQLSSSPKLARGYADDIKYLDSLLNKGNFTPVELNNIRRAFDKINTGMYTVKGQMRSGPENALDIKIREGLSNDIEAIANKYGISVKDMNTELRVGLALKDGILRALSQEQKNNLIGLQDIGIMGIFSGGNPGTAIALGIAKKGFEGIRPSIAQKLYNLNKSKNVKTPVRRGNTIPTSNRSGIIARPDTIPTSNTVPVKKTEPRKLKAIKDKIASKKSNPLKAKIIEKKSISEAIPYHKMESNFIEDIKKVINEAGFLLNKKRITELRKEFKKIMDIKSYDTSNGIISNISKIDRIEYIGKGNFKLYSKGKNTTIHYIQLLKDIKANNK